MKKLKAKALYAVLAGLCLAGAANAANVQIGVTGGLTDTIITTSQTWTANNVYNLAGQIYIATGATLTIEAGTVIKSIPSDHGSLAICRGAKIIANGTPTKPIIFTSTNDDLVTARNAITEWGNITIMGKALIGASIQNDGTSAQAYDEGDSPISPFGTITHHVNTGSPDGLNKCVMEGLVSEGLGDPKVLYGGNDDNDDSGSISYISLRYGGKVAALNVELNGLSMGGIGRETDVHHIDIWDNVDDGIETWGGTVNYKYISVWNIGDDNFDVDQGWRGKAQFGLLVQGYGADVPQGSGVGDNIFEIDGAERNDAQPVTTATIYNFTCIGQPGPSGGDQGIALRDEARVQFRNCIWMDVGENLLKEEISENPATSGWRYGTFGTLPYSSVWTSSFAESWNKSNPLTGGHANVAAYSQAQLQSLYRAQTDGNLAEISDSIFFNFNSLGFAAGYNNANGYDVVTALPGNHNVNNVKEPANSPIVSITRGTPVVLQGGNIVMRPVTALDPRAANDAVTSVASAPADGFFTPAPYRGAFSKDVNWAKGWTAASAYGLFPAADTATTPVASGATVVTVVSFPTISGVVYSIESSTDGKNWSPVKTLVGDGSTKTLSAEITVDSARVYRAIAQ